MQKLELELKTSTPLIARGADNVTFELLPQSIKGVMRYWFRALAANVIDINSFNRTSDSLIGLKKAEEELFGSTEIRSPFDILVSYNHNFKPLGRHKYNIDRENYDFKIIEEFKSISYVLYGVNTTEKEIIKELEKNGKKYNYLPENSIIKIKLLFKRQVSDDVLKAYVLLLEFISVYGGFGAKSRKGLGSFKIDVLNNDFHDKNYLERDFKDTLEKIETTFKKVFTSAKGYEPNKNNQIDVPDFPIVNSNCFSKTINLKTNDMIQAFVKVFLSDSRNKRYGYYSFVKKSCLRFINKNDSVDLIRKAIFNKEIPKSKIGPTILGLPLVYQRIEKEKSKPVNSKEKQKSIYGKDTINNNTGRKASPLHITFHKKTDGNYYCYLLLIPSKISEKRDSNEKPLLKMDKTKIKIIGNEDFKELQGFINESFEDKAGGSNGRK